MSAASQGLALTVLANGHNGSYAGAGPYKPAAYHGQAAAMPSVVVLVLIAAALAALTSRPARLHARGRAQVRS